MNQQIWGPIFWHAFHLFFRLAGASGLTNNDFNRLFRMIEYILVCQKCRICFAKNKKSLTKENWADLEVAMMEVHNMVNRAYNKYTGTNKPVFDKTMYERKYKPLDPLKSTDNMYLFILSWYMVFMFVVYDYGYNYDLEYTPIIKFLKLWVHCIGKISFKHKSLKLLYQQCSNVLIKRNPPDVWQGNHNEIYLIKLVRDMFVPIFKTGGIKNDYFGIKSSSVQIASYDKKHHVDLDKWIDKCLNKKSSNIPITRIKKQIQDPFTIQILSLIEAANKPVV
jgi:hypothetical protein